MVGIYKITSPSNSVYIGQSWDIKTRWRSYSKPTGAKNQIKLKHSFNKHGASNHRFEVVHELPYDCIQGVMDQIEMAYIVAYMDTGLNVLNLRIGGTSSGRFSDETRERMRQSQLGKKRAPFSDEHRRKIGDAHRDKKMSQEAIRKISISKLGKPSARRGTRISEESRQRFTDVQSSEEVRSKKSEAMKRIWADKKSKYTNLVGNDHS